jgi:hypothetical protein
LPRILLASAILCGCAPQEEKEPTVAVTITADEIRGAVEHEQVAMVRDALGELGCPLPEVALTEDQLKYDAEPMPGNYDIPVFWYVQAAKCESREVGLIVTLVGDDLAPFGIGGFAIDNEDPYNTFVGFAVDESSNLVSYANRTVWYFGHLEMLQRRLQTFGVVVEELGDELDQRGVVAREVARRPEHLSVATPELEGTFGGVGQPLPVEPQPDVQAQEGFQIPCDGSCGDCMGAIASAQVASAFYEAIIDMINGGAGTAANISQATVNHVPQVATCGAIFTEFAVGGGFAGLVSGSLLGNLGVPAIAGAAGLAGVSIEVGGVLLSLPVTLIVGATGAITAGGTVYYHCTRAAEAVKSPDHQLACAQASCPEGEPACGMPQCFCDAECGRFEECLETDASGECINSVPMNFCDKVGGGLFGGDQRWECKYVEGHAPRPNQPAQCGGAPITF